MNIYWQEMTFALILQEQKDSSNIETQEMLLESNLKINEHVEEPNLITKDVKENTLQESDKSLIFLQQQVSTNTQTQPTASAKEEEKEKQKEQLRSKKQKQKHIKTNNIQKDSMLDVIEEEHLDENNSIEAKMQHLKSLIQAMKVEEENLARILMKMIDNYKALKKHLSQSSKKRSPKNDNQEKLIIEKLDKILASIYELLNISNETQNSESKEAPIERAEPVEKQADQKNLELLTDLTNKVAAIIHPNEQT